MLNYGKLYAQNRLEVRRRHGLLEEKRDRNPLKAEKSPRKVEAFEYRPPPARPTEERWNYPESDWGLMAKFRSQKGIYDEIYHKEADYQKKVDQVAQIREENQKMIEAEFLRQKNQYALAKKQKEEADQQRFNSIMSMDISGGSRSHPSSANHQVSCFIIYKQHLDYVTTVLSLLLYCGDCCWANCRMASTSWI